MPTYAEPTDYGTAEEIRFDYDKSPLAERPILPEEMAAVITEYLSNIFSHSYNLMNSDTDTGLGYLASDQPGKNISVVPAMVADRSETFPKITVTPVPYQPAAKITGVSEAGINVKAGDLPISRSRLNLVQGGCYCTVQGEYREQERSLTSELHTLFLRDRGLFEEELKVKSFYPSISQEGEKTDDVGKSQSPGRDFVDIVSIQWMDNLITQMWTERPF